MNLFFTSPLFYIAACDLDNKRLPKMVVESAQILWTVRFIWDADRRVPFGPDLSVDFSRPPDGGKPRYTVRNPHRTLNVYQPTHKNHPTVRWAAESGGNWSSLYSYYTWASRVYRDRFGKTHQSYFRCADDLLCGLSETWLRSPATLPPFVYSTVRGYTPGAGARCGVYDDRSANNSIFDEDTAALMRNYQDYLSWKYAHDKTPPSFGGPNEQAPEWYRGELG